MLYIFAIKLILHLPLRDPTSGAKGKEGDNARRGKY